MRVLVTRPRAQADDWVARLRAQGVDALALPLLAIDDAPDTQAVQQAWQHLPAMKLAMFVSPNAVAAFFRARPDGAHWPAGVLAGATGPGTSGALREAGVPAALVVEPPAGGGRFDSEALWAELQTRDWRSAQALVVRGEGGRDWFAETLAAQGATVHFVEAYRRAAPALDDAARAALDLALQEPLQSLWLFSSSQAIGHLATLAPRADWSRSRAVATHPRIAESARALGFAEVGLSPPGFDELLAALRERG